MVAGIEITNEFNSILLSNNLQNPVLRASGNATTVTDDISPLGTSKLRISYTRASTSDTPLVAIRPSALTMYYAVEDITSLTWTWVFISDLPVGSSVPYWIFDKPPAASGNVGIEVYEDVTGKLMFSLQNKPLRITDVITGTMAAGIVTNDHVYESGHTYAALLCRWTRRGFYRALPNETDNRGLAARALTNGVTRGSVHYETVTGDDSGTTWAQMQLGIVDVTGY